MAWPALTTQASVEAATALAIGAAGTDDATEAQFTEALTSATAEITAQLPYRYRVMMEHIPGEVLTTYADGTTTEYSLSLSVASVLNVYLNYFAADSSRDWGARTVADVLDSDEYEYAAGTITFGTAPSEGTWIAAEYDLALAVSPSILSAIAVQLTAYHLLTAIINRQTPMETDYVNMFRAVGLEMLGKLASGEMGIAEFDDLELVEDWISPEQAGTFSTIGFARA